MRSLFPIAQSTLHLALNVFLLFVLLVSFFAYRPYTIQISITDATSTRRYALGRCNWFQATEWYDRSCSLPLPFHCKPRPFQKRKIYSADSLIFRLNHGTKRPPSLLQVVTVKKYRSQPPALFLISALRVHSLWQRQHFYLRFPITSKLVHTVHIIGNSFRFIPLHASDPRAGAVGVRTPMHPDAATSVMQDEENRFASLLLTKPEAALSSATNIRTTLQEWCSNAIENFSPVDQRALAFSSLSPPAFLPDVDDDHEVSFSILGKDSAAFIPLYFSNGTVVPAEMAMDFHEKRFRLTQLERLRDANRLMCLTTWASAANCTVDDIKQLIVDVHTVQPHFIPSPDFPISSWFSNGTQDNRGKRGRSISGNTALLNEVVPESTSTSLMATSQNLSRLEGYVYTLESQLKRPPTMEEWILKAELPSASFLHSTLKTGYAALTRLVTLSSPLVERIARKYSKSFTDFSEEELLVAGLQAVQKGMRRPTTYPEGIPIAASTWVWAKSGILSFIYKHKSEIRVPPSWWSLRSRGKEIEMAKETALGRRVAPEEVAQALGISATRWDRICCLTQPSVSTESPMKGGRSRPSTNRPSDTMGDLLISSEESMNVQQHGIEARLMQELFDILKACLEEHEQEAICFHFGLFDGRLKTMEETTLHLRLPMADVRSFLQKATFKLRTYETQRTLAQLNPEEKEQLKIKGHEALRQHVITHSVLQQLTRATLSIHTSGMDTW